ncbi:DUF4352 domain-containing protein [Streptosporangium sp. G12]
MIIQQKQSNGCLKGCLIVVVAVIGLGIVGRIVGASDDRPTPLADSFRSTAPSVPVVSAEAVPGTKAPQEEPKPEPEPKPELPRVGDTVRDGKFSFKITKVEKGVARVGSELFGSDAQGEYVIIHVNVKNVGDEAQTFSGGNQKLIDSRGREYDADTGAAIFIKDANSFLEKINPGNSVDGLLLFDMPKRARLSAIVLRDSLFSGGVTVSLR